MCVSHQDSAKGGSVAPDATAKNSPSPDKGRQEGFLKQAPIVFWDFEIDEKKRIAVKL
ncbi:MAG: hypothetical protein WCE90_04540 [Candidatus Zixiibacteriota bacterium]